MDWDKQKLSCEGRWIPLDDGHVPETLLIPSSTSSRAGKAHDYHGDVVSKKDEDDGGAGDVDRCLALYPEYVEERVPALHVYDDVVSTDLVQAIYDTTAQDSKPWGTYVSLEQLRHHWQETQQQQQQQQQKSSTNNDPHQATTQSASSDEHDGCTPNTNCQEQVRDQLALRAVNAFLQAALNTHQATISYTKSDNAAEKVKCFKPTGHPRPKPQNYNNNNDNHTLGTNTPNDTPPDTMEEENRDSSSSSAAAPLFWTKADLDRIHGVAVWALGATVGSQVPYHLDYAEQIRYETNRIVPPILAGTLQCTQNVTVDGGMYCAHMDGIPHYEHYGYKGIKQEQQQEQQSSSSPSILDTVDTDPGWVRVPYRGNRLILQSGHLPHLSTPIKAINNDTNTDHDSCIIPSKKKRVIMGFNVFLPDMGPWVQRAPEHSATFRRKVALHRWLLRSSQTTGQKPPSTDMSVSDPASKESDANAKDDYSTDVGRETLFSKDSPKDSTTLALAGRKQKRMTRGGGTGWNLESIRTNPSLRKLLILAKRQKVKQDLAQRRRDLDGAIQQQLKQSTSAVLVQHFMTQLGRTDGEYPTPDDIQVHLYHGIQQGQYFLLTDDDDEWRESRIRNTTNHEDTSHDPNHVNRKIVNFMVTPESRIQLATTVHDEIQE